MTARSNSLDVAGFDNDQMAFLALALRGAPFKVRRATLQIALQCGKSAITDHIASNRLPTPHLAGTPGAFWWSNELEDALTTLAEQDQAA